MLQAFPKKIPTEWVLRICFTRNLHEKVSIKWSNMN
jgi:hypothetical protein